MGIGVIIGAALVVVCFICIVLISSNAGKLKRGGVNVNMKKARSATRTALIVLLCAAVMLVVVPGSIHTVNAGEVAVVKHWGKAEYTRAAGTYFDFWLTKEYVKYDVTVQQEDISTMAYSSDAQTMDIQMVVQYQIQPEHAVDIVNNYGGLQMLANRIESISIEKAKTVLSTKSAMDIVATRATVSPAIEQLIKEAVTDEYFVNVVTVVVTNIDFSDNFEYTVEQKMIAEQEKIKAEYEKEKAIVEAEKELEVARLAAEAALATAEGNAKAQIELAEAQARAIKLKSVEIARMLGFEITETEEDYNISFEGKSADEIALISEYLKYAEYLEVWNGVLPETLVSDTAAGIILSK